MTKEITVNINCNSWSITFPKNSDNEIFTQPHLPKLKIKLVVDPEEGEVEHPDNAAVGGQEDHEPVEYEEPAAQQEVRS